MKYRVVIVTLSFLLSCALTGWADKPLSSEEKNQPVTKVEQTKARNSATPASLPVTDQTTHPTFEPLEFGTETQPTIEGAEEAADYQVPWKSINGGGGNASTATHKVSVSIGQSTIGFATTATHQAGIGYWYGIFGGGCDCGVKGDMNCDATVQPIDVTYLINWVYRSQNDICNAPNCPYVTGDLDCSGDVAPIDVVYIINYVYRSQNDICDGCAP